MRSSSGPDRRRWWRARSAAVQRQVVLPHAARARVRGGDEHEAGRERHHPLRADDRDAAVLERLAERLEARAGELGQLVEEQDAVVGERGLAGRRRGAAADQAGRRDRVVRRAERARADQPAAAVQAGDRLDARHLDRLDGRERRQDRRARGGRASSCPCRAARAGRGCGRRRRRPRSPGSARCGRGRRRGRARARRPPPRRRRPGSAAPARRRAAARRPAAPSRRPRISTLGHERGLACPRAAARAGARGRGGGRPRRSPARRGSERTSPVSDSSPTTAVPSSASASSSPPATSSATASGRSNPGPILRRSAGARLTVMRRSGNSKPEFTSADRTRSRASRTALSASPTTVNAGRPWRMSASTQTRRLATPSRAKVEMRAITRAAGRHLRTRRSGGRGGRAGRRGPGRRPRRRTAGPRATGGPRPR